MSDEKQGGQGSGTLTLIQIEEPSDAVETFSDPGLVLALDLSPAGLAVAVAVGGNAAPVVTVSPVADHGAADDGLVAMLRDARRITMQRTGRIAGRAVFIVTPGLALEGRQRLVQAADAAGLDLLACIERPVALAYGVDLARFGAGAFFLVEDGAVACLTVRGGQIRLVAWGDNYAAVLADVLPRPVRGAVLVGGAPSPDAGLAVLARMESGDAALLGAALLGEDLG